MKIYPFLYLISILDLMFYRCEDFYNFACGSFIKNHELLPNESMITEMQFMQKNLDEQMNELLNSSDAFLIRPFMLSKSLYRSCMYTSKS